jgi:hypothetical protein
MPIPSLPAAARHDRHQRHIARRVDLKTSARGAHSADPRGFAAHVGPHGAVVAAVTGAAAGCARGPRTGKGRDIGAAGRGSHRKASPCSTRGRERPRGYRVIAGIAGWIRGARASGATTVAVVSRSAGRAQICTDRIASFTDFMRKNAA